MASKFDQAINKLFELQKFGIKLGLNSTELMLKRLGNPHLKMPCLHLAGTNGKGSVGAMCQAALMEAGVKTGMYISPHLVRFTERFLINGREISREKTLELIDAVWEVVDHREPPTFFEFVTAMGFLYFAREEVELAIMEVGLGGRLDATNVCLPKATVITNIGLEHQEYLGNTLAKIAWEKAGVIKSGIPVVHGVTQPPARREVENKALKLGAPVIRKGRDITFRRGADGSFSLKGRNWRLKGLETNLAGRHQPGNACLALGALECLAEAGFPLEPGHFAQGLKKVRWPGRLEKVPTPEGMPPLWLDGAHNVPAAKALLASLDDIRQGRSPLVMVMGIMADKDIKTLLGLLAPAADKVVFTRPVYQRAANPEVLAQEAPQGLDQRICGELGQAIRLGMDLAGEHGVVLITGSLFTVGESKDWLAKNPF